MRQRESRSSAASPGWLLLLGVLLIGLLQMHSFGHVGHDPGAAGSAMAAGHPVAAGHPDVSTPAEAPPPHPVPEPGGELDLLAMCLAVLTSISVIGALIGLLVAGGSSGGHRGAPLTRLFVARGPPPAAAPLIGNRLARLSVLRI